MIQDINNNQRNTLVRKWIRENGAATFDFSGKSAILNDGLLFSIESQLKELPALNIKCKEQIGEHFDWKNHDIILTDGLIWNIEKEIKRLNKVKEVRPTSMRGIYQIQLTKHKYKTECYKCRIWFRELHNLIKYFQGMEKLLNTLGYDTGNKKNDILPYPKG
jgi:hypothetical protein